MKQLLANAQDIEELGKADLPWHLLPKGTPRTKEMLYAVASTWLLSKCPYFCGEDETWTPAGQVYFSYLKFALTGRHTYVLGSEFGKELAKVPLRLSWECVPFLDKPICIELPPELWFRSKGSAFTSIVCETFRHGSGISLQVAITSKLDFSQTLATNFDSASETIEETLRAKVLPAGSLGIFTLALNALLYIHSGNPDLRHMRLGPKPEQRSKIPAWERRRQTMSEHPYTLVGFDFKKPKLYSVDSTEVSGHFRWQRCGEKFSQVRLIWIEPHIRTYKEEEPELIESA